MKTLWRVVESVFNISISFKSIIGVDDSCEYDNIVTIVSFLIYKEWLLFSLESKSRKSNIILQHFKDELITRLRIYELCTRFSAKEMFNIEALIESL